MKPTFVILFLSLTLISAEKEFGRQGRQFNQNYFPGSISTNINNAAAYPGGFTGQQVYGYGSSANNFAYGKKKREATDFSSLTKREAQYGYPGFGAGYGSNFIQNYGYGSHATNYGRK